MVKSVKKIVLKVHKLTIITIIIK